MAEDGERALGRSIYRGGQKAPLGEEGGDLDPASLGGLFCELRLLIFAQFIEAGVQRGFRLVIFRSGRDGLRGRRRGGISQRVARPAFLRSRACATASLPRALNKSALAKPSSSCTTLLPRAAKISVNDSGGTGADSFGIVLPPGEVKHRGETKQEGEALGQYARAGERLTLCFQSFSPRTGATVRANDARCASTSPARAACGRSAGRSKHRRAPWP